MSQMRRDKTRCERWQIDVGGKKGKSEGGGWPGIYTLILPVCRRPRASTSPISGPEADCIPVETTRREAATWAPSCLGSSTGWPDVPRPSPVYRHLGSKAVLHHAGQFAVVIEHIPSIEGIQRSHPHYLIFQVSNRIEPLL